MSLDVLESAPVWVTNTTANVTAITLRRSDQQILAFIQILLVSSFCSTRTNYCAKLAVNYYWLHLVNADCTFDRDFMRTIK